MGRDVLLGCLFGAFAIVLIRLGWFVPSRFGYPPLQPYSGPQWQFLGAHTIIADISNQFILALFLSLTYLFVLFLLRALLRKEWAAAVTFVLLFTLLIATANRSLDSPVYLATELILNSLTVFLLIRFGLLAVVAAEVFNDLLGSFPFTTQVSSWYAGISLAGIVLLAAIALYAFYTSLGGRPAFGSAVLEE